MQAMSEPWCPGQVMSDSVRVGTPVRQHAYQTLVSRKWLHIEDLKVTTSTICDQIIPYNLVTYGACGAWLMRRNLDTS